MQNWFTVYPLTRSTTSILIIAYHHIFFFSLTLFHLSRFSFVFLYASQWVCCCWFFFICTILISIIQICAELEKYRPLELFFCRRYTVHLQCIQYSWNTAILLLVLGTDTFYPLSRAFSLSLSITLSVYLYLSLCLFPLVPCLNFCYYFFGNSSNRTTHRCTTVMPLSARNECTMQKEKMVKKRSS